MRTEKTISISAPDKSRAVAAALLTVMVLGSLLVLTMPRTVGLYDEAIILTDAMLVAAGQIPHRDFYSVYGPAQYYIVKNLQQMTGEQFMAARVYDIACKTLIGGFLAYIIRDLAGRIVTLVTVSALTVWVLQFSGFSLYPIYPCLILGLLATYIMVPVPLGQSDFGSIVLRPTVAGACAGATALFRYDVGFFLLVANLVGSGVLVSLREPTRAGARKFSLIVVAYGFGAGLVFAPVAVAFLTVASWRDFWHDIVVFPATYYPGMRGLPFPLPWTADAPAVYFAPVVAAAGLAEAVWTSRATRALAIGHGSRIGSGTGAEARIQAVLVLFSLCALGFFTKGVVRVSSLHMFLGNVPALVVAAVLARRWLDRSRVAPAVMVVLLLIVFAAPALEAARVIKGHLVDPGRVLAGVLAKDIAPRIAALGDSACRTTAVSDVATYPPDYARVANYIARRTRPDDRIFVALDHHDKIFNNAELLYFATGRLPGTHWHHFDPGLQTRADIQAAVVADLKANRVQWVVRDGSIDNPNEPNGSARSSGVTLLDQYLATAYRSVASSGRIEVLLAKSSSSAEADRAYECEARAID